MGFILMAASGLAMLVLMDIAVAQQSPAASSTTSPQPQAPVGHRQPQAKDVAAEPRSDQAIKDMDRNLEKALKSICRGC